MMTNETDIEIVIDVAAMTDTETTAMIDETTDQDQVA